MKLDQLLEAHRKYYYAFIDEGHLDEPDDPQYQGEAYGQGSFDVYETSVYLDDADNAQIRTIYDRILRSGAGSVDIANLHDAPVDTKGLKPKVDYKHVGSVKVIFQEADIVDVKKEEGTFNVGEVEFLYPEL